MNELISVYELLDGLAVKGGDWPVNEWAFILRFEKLPKEPCFHTISGRLPDVWNQEDFISKFEERALRSLAADRLLAILHNSQVRGVLPEWYRTDRLGSPMLIGPSDRRQGAALACLGEIVRDFDILLKKHQLGEIVFGKSDVWPRINAERKALCPVGFRKSEILVLLNREGVAHSLDGDAIANDLVDELSPTEPVPPTLETFSSTNGPQEGSASSGTNAVARVVHMTPSFAKDSFSGLFDKEAREALSGQDAWPTVKDAVSAVWSRLRQHALLPDGKRPNFLKPYNGRNFEYDEVGAKELSDDACRKRVKTLLGKLGKHP